MNHLLDVLAYKRMALQQFQNISTILGGFSISGMVALLVLPARDRIHRILFVQLSLAAVAFIFAMTLGAVMLPAAISGPHTVAGVRAVLSLADVVIYTVTFGFVALLSAIGCAGYAFTRRIGHFTVAISLIMLGLLAWCFVGLARALGST